jgi:hypothetical protein
LAVSIAWTARKIYKRAEFLDESDIKEAMNKACSNLKPIILLFIEPVKNYFKETALLGKLWLFLPENDYFPQAYYLTF